MATFASVTFNTARYAAARPTYPKQLYEFIFDYHRGHPAAQFETAVDLGCGTGKYSIVAFRFTDRCRPGDSWLDPVQTRHWRRPEHEDG